MQKINLPLNCQIPFYSLNAAFFFVFAAAHICVKAICYCDYQWEEGVLEKGVHVCMCARVRASDIMLR